MKIIFFFFFSSRRRHTRYWRDWSSDVCSSDLDVNRLGQTRETMVGWDLDRYVRRAEAFGWQAIAIDGHDVDAIGGAYDEAVKTTGKPTAIFARTKKGKGVKAVEDQPGKHGKPLDDPEAAIAELGGERDLSVDRKSTR